jgi:carboxyl-terminal processing protease
MKEGHNMDDMQMPVWQEPRKQKKKPGFGTGFGVGVLVSVIVLTLVFVLGTGLYCRLTGMYLVFGGTGATAVKDSKVLDQATTDKVAELTSYMDLYYYEDYSLEDVQNALLDGMVSGLNDPYTVYYTPEEYESLMVSTSGTYYGIGAGLTQDTDTMVVTISKVYEGTPAEEAGLLKDDIIVSVDGVDATSMEVSDLVQMIRGEEGTTVSIEIYRASTDEELTFEVERRNVQLPSVAGQMLDDGIGYIQIGEFQSGTADQFETILNQLEEQGMQSLIVDVRDNPGGLLSSVVSILDVILPEGTVVYTEDKYGNRDTYTSDASCIDYPMVVLVNGNSASASEIFAGAIKDYEYGTLLGTTTFGKGIVQSIFSLSDGDALKITTAKYYTPNGYNIHGTGIDPDIELEYEFLGPDGTSYEMQYDNQLLKAIEILSE